MNKKEPGVPDFVLLSALTEDALMESLLARYKGDCIYVCLNLFLLFTILFKSLYFYLVCAYFFLHWWFMLTFSSHFYYFTNFHYQDIHWRCGYFREPIQEIKHL